MQKRNAKSRPEAAFGSSCKLLYFIAPEAAFMTDEAALMADEAASIAEVAADEAAAMAEEAPASGVVTTVVVDVDVDGAIVDGGVVVVVISSFFEQAAKDTAAARVTISNAVFIFLLGFKVRTTRQWLGNPRSKSPSIQRHGNLAFPVPNPRL